VGNVSVEWGRGDDRTIGGTGGRVGEDLMLCWEREAVDGCATIRREGERPRCGLKGK
jgi:hypothetical protein